MEAAGSAAAATIRRGLGQALMRRPNRFVFVHSFTPFALIQWGSVIIIFTDEL